jgi:hypothetical protein
MFSHKKFYSKKEIVRRFLKGKWVEMGIAGYARNLNRLWKRQNKIYLRVIDLLKPNKGPKISVDYEEEVILDN